MTVAQAINIFKKRFSDLVILKCINYSEEHYIIEAVKDENVVDYNLPYYAVDKNNGRVTVFIPTLDLDGFFDAVENRTVYYK